MPQDSPEQAIVRGALRRFPQNIGGGPFDHQLTLSADEINQIRIVLENSLREPAETTAGDAPVAIPAKKSAKTTAKKSPPKKKKKKR